MILMISRTDILKEYLLPMSDGIDYEILLQKEVYRMNRDVHLKLENTEGQWYIKESEEYSINNVEEGFGRIALTNELRLRFLTKDKELFQAISIHTVKNSLAFAKYDISRLNNITIGSGDDKNISYSFMKYMSKDHAVLRKNVGVWYIENTGANGTFLNGYRINGLSALNFGDEINAFGLRIIFLGNVLAVGSHYGNLVVKGLTEMVIPQVGDIKSGGVSERTYYHRSPRNIPRIYCDKITIESAPEAKFGKKRSLLAQIGPSLTMALPMLLGCMLSMYAMRSSGSSSAFMYTGLITAVGSALIGAVWAIMNIREERRDEQKNENVRFNEYGSYLIEISEKLKERYSGNRNAMYTMYPAPGENCLKTSESPDLWNRNFTHEDFMYYRIGVGNIPFQVTIESPQERFTLGKDFLRDKVKKLVESYQTLENVPIGVDLFKNNLFGMIGGSKKRGAIQLMYSIVSGIAACNCYTDVKMVFIYDEKENPKKWDFVKWFPHVWSENRRTRYVASNSNELSDVMYELVNIMRRRDENAENNSHENIIPKPHYVIFVSDPRILDNQLVAKYILKPSPHYGLTAMIMAERYEELPNECVYILENTDSFKGYYKTTAIAEKTEIKFDVVTAKELSTLAKNLSDLQVQEIESDTEIPAVLDFFEMYGVDSLEKLNVLELWYKNRSYNSMRALIGKKAGGAECYLDIHEKFHGPHGLVAGTTGSGKSEILQTYILSLALNFSPDDVAFFIIDYKGGGMSNLFSDLPHMAGEISNLSGNQVRRAMISIKSENRRRQRIFSEYGVNNINLYTRLYKSHEAKLPIPHLIIVIDEFAELKREEPDFMKELISVAQVGRSLGVHLILATQKPNGTVDDNIRSNSKFHLCLRVQDRQDSNDMLGKPDAAYITQAGRSYIQVGNDEIYDLFQSGWSGAVYDRNMADKNDNIATMITLTGKPAIYGSRTKMKRRERERLAWYDYIIKMIRYVRNENIPNMKLSELNQKELDEFSDSVYKMMCSQQNYESSSNNRTNVFNFVKLYAQGIITDAASAMVISGSGVRLPELKERTQLEVLVKYIRSVAENGGFNYKLRLWLPVLPEMLIYSDVVKDKKPRLVNGNYAPLDEKDFTLSAVAGLLDDPENQLQLPTSVDFAVDGNLAVIASVSTGKSTFMQTLIYSLVNNYTPDELNMYILDFSSHRLGCYGKLPHVGGFITENDSDRIAKFFMMTDRMMKKRQEELNGGSYRDYVRAYGRKIPAVVIFIDNYGTFKEKTGGVYDDAVTRISRDGQSVGIFLAVSAGGFGMDEISLRTAENIKTVICLDLGDKFKFMEVLRSNKINILPEADVKGRGLVKYDDKVLEFQTAVAVEAEDDYERSEKLAAFSEKLADSWKGASAAEIPHIPEKPVLADLERVSGYNEAVLSKRYMPVGYKDIDASLECIDLSCTFLYTFAGRKRTGKTNAMKIAIEMAAKKDGDIVIIERGKNELKQLSEQVDAKYIESSQGLFDFLAEIKDPFVRRNRRKHELMDQGMEDIAIYEAMTEFKPVFIFIASLEEFLQMAYMPDDGAGQMSGFLENIFDKGELHNIFFFACADPDNSIDCMGFNGYNIYMNRHEGMHFGGCLDRQKQFTAVNLNFAEQSRSMPRGVALTPYKDDDSQMYKVIVPVIGGEAK